MDSEQIEASVPEPVAEARQTAARGNPVEAAIAWGLCRLLGLGGSEAAIGCVSALKDQARTAEAERVLERAVGEFIDDEPLMAEFCWAAHDRRDWSEAAHRWAIYRQRFKENFLGFGIGCVALRELQKFDDADAVAHEGMRLFPDRAEMMGNFAWIAHQRADWQTAERRWRAYIEKYPDHPIGYAAAGVVLREMGMFDAADEVLRAGLERCPDHSELLGNFAWVSFHRQDWAEALRRWTEFRDKFPDDPLGHRQVMLVLGELGRFDEVEQIERAAKSSAANDELATLMLRFESLGFNCEFGVVQSHFGAQPLGLLRFTATPWNFLRDALQRRFEGVGDPEYTTLIIQKGEYMTGDSRFHMAMHTFIRATDDDREKRFNHFCRRLRFLKDKLIRDLTDAEKIFVYAGNERLTEDDARSLFSAIRSYGAGRLLLVQESDDLNTDGECRLLCPGLAIGFIEKLDVYRPKFQTWLALCNAASELLKPERGYVAI